MLRFLGVAYRLEHRLEIVPRIEFGCLDLTNVRQTSFELTHAVLEDFIGGSGRHN